MDRRRAEVELQAVLSELQALKRKLHSKSEALIIITKDLDGTRKERDQFKLMAEKLRVRCQAYKRQFSDYPLTRDQASLIQMLRDMKNQKLAYQRQNEALQQKLSEAQGDVKLLRERFARQRIGDEGVGPRHFPAHEREELVEQLEKAKQLAEQYRQDCNSVSDEISELREENKEFKMKSERLNNELNFMLNGDKKRIIDIDALCMENKYLQERVKQCQEEKNSLHAQLNKMKTALSARKAAQSEIIPGKMRTAGLVISPKQVKEILLNGAGLPSSAETVADLQSIAAALLETINDKNLALHHLRNTNKILGNRVAELERKLRTLEVAGLWSMSEVQRQSGHSTPKIRIEVPEKESDKNLVPTTETDEEFMSSLGSRLSRLTDVCAKNFKEYKLVSLTPDGSSADDASQRGSATDLAGSATSGSVGALNGDSSTFDEEDVDFYVDATMDDAGAMDSSGDVTASTGGDASCGKDDITFNNHATSCEDGAADVTINATVNGNSALSNAARIEVASKEYEAVTDSTRGIENAATDATDTRIGASEDDATNATVRGGHVEKCHADEVSVPTSIEAEEPCGTGDSVCGSATENATITEATATCKHSSTNGCGEGVESDDVIDDIINDDDVINGYSDTVSKVRNLETGIAVESETSSDVINDNDITVAMGDVEAIPLDNTTVHSLQHESILSEENAGDHGNDVIDNDDVKS